MSSPPSVRVSISTFSSPSNRRAVSMKRSAIAGSFTVARLTLRYSRFAETPAAAAVPRTIRSTFSGSAAQVDCAYVGDSPFDVRAAKAAGMYAVAVTWGGIHARNRLEEEEPDAVVDSAEELLGVV